MLSTFLAFLLALAITAIVTPQVRNFALRRDLAKVPRSLRDVHDAPIPRLGGIAIAIGFMVPIIGLLLTDSGLGRYIQRDHPEWLHYVMALGGGTAAILALGIYDDLRGANAWQKLFVHVVVGCLVWKLGVRIDVLGFFGSRIETGVFSLPLTVIWIVVVINAMNLIDGLDGLASGVAFMAVVPNLIIAIHNQNVVMMVLMASLGGSLLGFLFYNFRPASIFMGDTGSMFLGFVLATGSILGNAKATATVSMIAPVLALGLPIMDTLLAVFRRHMAGMPLFDADNDHMHHRLLKRGLSHKQAVLVMYAVSFVLAAGALLSVFVRGPAAAALVFVLVGCAGLFIRRLGYLSWVTGSRRRNQELRMHIRAVCAHIRAARHLTAVWHAMQPVRELLEVASIDLVVGEERFSWHEPTAPAVGTSKVELVAAAVAVGELRVGWSGPAGTEPQKTALILVSDAIGDAIGQMRLAEPDPAAEAATDNVIPLRRPSQSA